MTGLSTNGVRGRSPPRQATRGLQKNTSATHVSRPLSPRPRDAESPTRFLGSGREVHEKPLVSVRSVCEDRLAASAKIQRKAHDAYVTASERLEKSEANLEAARSTLDSFAEQERRCRIQGTSMVGGSMRKNWEAKIQGLEERREMAEEALAVAVSEAERDRRHERSAQESVRRSILESRASFHTLDQLRSTQKNSASSAVSLPSRWRAPIAGTPNGEAESTPGSRKIISPRSSPRRGEQGGSPTAAQSPARRRFTRVDTGNLAYGSEALTQQPPRLSKGSSEVSLASSRLSCSSDASFASTASSSGSLAATLALSPRKHDGRFTAVSAAGPVPMQHSPSSAAVATQRRRSVTAELATVTAGSALPTLLASQPSLSKPCSLPECDKPLGTGKELMASLSKMSPEDLRKYLSQVPLEHLEMVSPSA